MAPGFCIENISCDSHEFRRLKKMRAKFWSAPTKARGWKLYPHRCLCSKSQSGMLTSCDSPGKTTELCYCYYCWNIIYCCSYYYCYCCCCYKFELASFAPPKSESRAEADPVWMLLLLFAVLPLINCCPYANSTRCLFPGYSCYY